MTKWIPTFHFHVREGDRLIVDDNGIELDNAGIARDEALRGARSLLSEAVLKGHLPLGHAIVVTDSDGGIVCEVGFGEAVGD